MLTFLGTTLYQVWIEKSCSSATLNATRYHVPGTWYQLLVYKHMYKMSIRSRRESSIFLIY